MPGTDYNATWLAQPWSENLSARHDTSSSVFRLNLIPKPLPPLEAHETPADPGREAAAHALHASSGVLLERDPTMSRGDTPPHILFRNRFVGNYGHMARYKAGPGRPSKGDRDAFVTRPARDVGNEIRRRAEEAGMPYGEYIAALLAYQVGRPDLAPRSAVQEALLIKRTA
jgi:hypothetical protein